MPSKRTDEVLAYVAANVQRLRAKLELTQQGLADAINLDLRHLRRIERGSENITMETLVALADALSVGPAALLRKATPRAPRTGRPRKRSRGA